MVLQETVRQIQGCAMHRLGGQRSTLHVLSISVSELTIFNPRCMREGYGSCSVCVYVCLLPCYLLHTSFASPKCGFIRFLMAHVFCRFR